ncbi:hypothetical protein FRC01_005696 [Tulasnella sp. 417]|nr:hypothetical protein FRC01_005696 [Tulasnella sp. 417]
MSSNTESPSPTSSPSRPRPTRKATSRSATPPVFKATLSRRSSLAAPVAATTREHTYSTPAEPAAEVFSTPAALAADETQPVSNAPPTSLQFDPGVTFPSEQISVPAQQPIPDQNNEDMSRERSDSGASTSRRGSLFGNLARPLRRSGSISDSGASAPALASLLETQQKDQAARDAVKARSSIDAAGASDVGSGSEAESNPLAPRRKPKRQNTFSKMVGNLGNAESAQSEFTPPITPDSAKFPEIPRGKRVGPSKLAGGEFPGNYKDSASAPDDDGTAVEGGLSDLLPSRETVDMAAQYASTLLKKINLQARGMWPVSANVPARQRLHDHSRKKKI